MNEPNLQRRGPRLVVVFLWMLSIAVAVFVGHRFGDAMKQTLVSMLDDLRGGRDAAPRDERLHTCGMHPSVLVHGPGICPFCQMELVPVDPSRIGHDVVVDPRIAQNIGVRTALVGTGPLQRTLRTVGTIGYDESGLRDVTLKVPGWIETLHVDRLGAKVAVGDPLFELYSPDLLTAQQELLIALREGESAAAAPRTRLRLFDIDDAQIDDLAHRGEVARTLTLRSKVAGVVIEKDAVQGMRAEEGMRLFRVGNLDRVWVAVTVYESQIPFVEVGQEARMTLAYVPGQEFVGKVTWIQPWVDARTRQVQVRLEFDNALGLLKPGMYASVVLSRTLAAERTLLPRSAVVDTGRRTLAFVALNDGHFEPRDLRLGVETDAGMVEVLDGVKPGESVVVSAQFLLDSESRLREAMLRMVREGLEGGASAGSDPVAELADLPEALDGHLTTVVRAYLGLADALTRDALPAAADARGLAAELDAALALPLDGFWSHHDEAAVARGKALELIAAQDIETARRLFADLGVALGTLLRATGVPRGLGAGLEELHCPMYREEQGGGMWLQTGPAVRNPFMGPRMLGCFDRRQRLPAARSAQDTVSPALPAESVDRIAESYLRASAILAADGVAGLDEQWHAMATALTALHAAAKGEAQTLVDNLTGAIPKDGLDVVAARAAFAPLSTALIALLRAHPSDRELVRAHCPMVEASWLQPPGRLANPYMGSAMLTCGTVEETMPRAKGR
ncbi:MAG: efflux RND transporter periplasmic adaptor subunit [Planctomycetota bacterium]